MDKDKSEHSNPAGRRIITMDAKAHERIDGVEKKLELHIQQTHETFDDHEKKLELGADMFRQVLESIDGHQILIKIHDDRLNQGSEMFSKFIEKIDENTALQKKLAFSVAGAVDMEKEIKNVIAAGVTVQKIGWYLLKIPFIGYVLYHVYTWLLKAAIKIFAVVS